MNWLDVIILLPCIWFAFKGFKNGLIFELASILALILGVWATVRFSSSLAIKLGDSKIYLYLSFAIIFIAVLVAVHFAGKLFEKLIKLLIPDIINHIAGLVFGVMKVVIIFSVLLMFINKVDFKHVILKPETKSASFSYKYVEPVAPFLSNWCIKEFGDKENTSSETQTENPLVNE